MGVNYSFEEVEQTHTKDNNTRHHKHPRCLVVEKYKLAVLCCCAAKNWEAEQATDGIQTAELGTDMQGQTGRDRESQIITGKDSVKRRRSVCSSEEGNRSEDEEPEDILPVLRNHSQLLNDQHLESLANHLPARTQGYPWNLVYSTAIHGTSLKTLYRQMAHIDSPVLLVIKDMEKKVFGAFSSHPFRVSDCCYGTGETFVYSFGPAFKAYRWSGENSYFIRGHMDSLQIGGGGGLFGLWLDADLYYGASFPCHTFNNQPLSTQQDFTVQDLEVWTVQ